MPPRSWPWPRTSGSPAPASGSSGGRRAAIRSWRSARISPPCGTREGIALGPRWTPRPGLGRMASSPPPGMMKEGTSSPERSRPVTAIYLGTLDRADPLYDVLASCSERGAGWPVYHVDRLSTHHLVFRYSEEATGQAVVGKFFHLQEPDEQKRARISGEYGNLLHLRTLGFASFPFAVVRPLCREERIGLAV